MTTLHESTIDKGKKDKISTIDNGKLTDKHLKCGSLKGRIKHYSKELRCYFFLKPGVDFAEVEERYLEAYIQSTSRVKNAIKDDLKAV